VQALGFPKKPRRVDKSSEHWVGEIGFSFSLAVALGAGCVRRAAFCNET
jgi:hypothetical protein